jgi:dephospho-CoA kinase
VRQAREDFVTGHPAAAALVFEIPLLFETGGEKEFDKVVVVSAPAEVQRARVLERTGMSSAKLDSILARQSPDEEKRARADFVVDTGGDLSTTESQVRDILACLGVGRAR